MALLLGVSANIGVSTMVSSFRLTFVAFLDQRLAAELYVRAETPETAPALEAYLQTAAREVLPLLSAERRLAGQPSEIYGVRVGPTYRENWAFLAASPLPWDAVDKGEAVVVNEQLARRAGFGRVTRLRSGRASPCRLRASMAITAIRLAKRL